jgi:hypothetical protein
LQGFHRWCLHVRGRFPTYESYPPTRQAVRNRRISSYLVKYSYYIKYSRVYISSTSEW